MGFEYWVHAAGEMLVNQIPLICSYEQLKDLLLPFRHLRDGKGMGSLFCFGGFFLSMQNEIGRTLTILADGEPVTGCARAKMLGNERSGLYSSLFMLHLWNAEEDYLALSGCKEVTVMHDYLGFGRLHR